MTLDQIADEALMRLHEAQDRVEMMQRAVFSGRAKIQQVEVDQRRSRLPVDAAIARALKIMAARRAELPADLLAAIEQAEDLA